MRTKSDAKGTRNFWEHASLICTTAVENYQMMKFQGVKTTLVATDYISFFLALQRNSILDGTWVTLSIKRTRDDLTETQAFFSCRRYTGMLVMIATRSVYPFQSTTRGKERQPSGRMKRQTSL